MQDSLGSSCQSLHVTSTASVLYLQQQKHTFKSRSSGSFLRMLNVTAVWSTSPPAPSPDPTWTSPIQPGQSSRRCLCRTCRRLTLVLLDGGAAMQRWSLGYRSSVANSLAPLSSHITPIISCRRRLPGENKRRYWGGGDREVHLSWDVTYIQHPRQSGPPGSRSEPWPSRWSPPAWQTRSPVLQWREGHVKKKTCGSITTAEDYIKDGCLFCAPAGRNTSPLPYTDQNSASCETYHAGKGRHRLLSSTSLDRKDLSRSAHLDVRQYARERYIHSFDCVGQLHKLASSKRKQTQENIHQKKTTTYI